MSRSYFIALAFVVLGTTVSQAKGNKPEWVENNGLSTEYSSTLYITGFGIGEGKKESDRLTQAKQHALAALSEIFLTQIQSNLLVSEIETESSYQSLVKSTISSQSNIHLIDVQTLMWNNRMKQQTFVLALLEIEPAIGNYTRHMVTLLENIEHLVATAKEAEEAGDLELSIKMYRGTFPLFIELGEARTVLNLLQGKSPFGEFEETLSKVTINQGEIESRISRLLKREIKSISSAAYILAEQLTDQLESKSISLRVYPLTYENTGFSSQFASYFHSVLESELISFFTILSEKSTQIDMDAVLTGTYWLNDNQCRLQVIITDLKNGSKLAAGGVNIPKSVTSDARLELLPRNFEKAMEDGRIFLVKDVIPGKLSLEAWTSKGNRNLIFKEDEEITLSIRVNKPCYLQIIYHLADGARILLENDLYVDVSKVNHVYTLPDTFYIAPPFGVERLQIFARTEKFDFVKVSTVSFEGEFYENVLVEDIREHTVALRGLKKKKTGPQIAEKTLTITTIKKR